MTGLYRFIPFRIILIFGLWPYPKDYVIPYVKEFKIYSVETVSESEVQGESRDL